MSVFLIWDHPELAISEAINAIEIERKMENTQSIVAAGADVPWGFFEDTENNNIDAEYFIRYITYPGIPVVIQNDHIRRMQRTDQQCVISMSITDKFGFPVIGKRVEVSDPSDIQAGKVFCTNRVGLVQFPALRKNRIMVAVDGRHTKLDCIVPDAPSATWDDLLSNGSMLDADQRGWY